MFFFFVSSQRSSITREFPYPNRDTHCATALILLSILHINDSLSIRFPECLGQISESEWDIH